MVFPGVYFRQQLDKEYSKKGVSAFLKFKCIMCIIRLKCNCSS